MSHHSIFGPPIEPGEEFQIRFDNKGTLTLERAALLNGITQGSASIFAENGKWVGTSNNFTSNVPVPISSSLLLLASGLMGLPGIKKQILD